MRATTRALHSAALPSLAEASGCLTLPPPSLPLSTWHVSKTESARPLASPLSFTTSPLSFLPYAASNTQYLGGENGPLGLPPSRLPLAYTLAVQSAGPRSQERGLPPFLFMVPEHRPFYEGLVSKSILIQLLQRPMSHIKWESTGNKSGL